MPNPRPTGMFGFVIVWIGQLVSLLGTSMTAFSLTIWAYEKTGSATTLALVGFFHVAPMLVFSPFAGAIVDRSNRKLMMVVSDLGSGLATILIFTLYASDRLEIWHLYIAAAIMGIFQSFQWPAYSAAISTMIPKEQYGRASGLMSLADTSSGIFAPILAGALLGIIGLNGILIIDIVTFGIAIGALMIVSIPQPKLTLEGQKARGNLFREAAYGLGYILERPSLLGLQIVFLLGNFFFNIPFAVMAAMILASTSSNEIILATVNSAGAIGGVIGGLLMSAWGGPKRRVYGVLGGWFLSSTLGMVIMGVGNSLPVWAASNFMMAFFTPIINGSNQAIWQAKVAPDIQGRVFSIRRLIAWFVSPLAMLIAGPLSDKILEPAMQAGGSLAERFGWLVGTGPGAGMSLLFIFGGLGAACVVIGGYLVPVIRNAEELLPDHDQMAAAPITDRQSRLQELLDTRMKLISEPNTPERERALKEITQQLRLLGRSPT